MFGLINNMLFRGTHYKGTNTGTQVLHSCHVSLSVWLLKRKDNAEQPAAIQ